MEFNLMANASYIGILVLGVLLVYIGNLFANMRVSGLYNANHELTENNNMALALRRTGLIIGLAIPISSILGLDAVTLDHVLYSLRDAIVAIALLFAALYIADKVLLPCADADEEIKNKNIAVGIMEFGLLVATGLVMQGSFSGHGVWYSAIVFFLLGQIVLVGTVKLYARYVLKVNGSVSQKPTVAILMASYLIGLGMILRVSILGDFVSWEKDLFSFALWTLLGAILLALLSTSIIDKLFFPTTSIRQEIEDENIAGMLYTGAIKIAVSILIANIVLL